MAKRMKILAVVSLLLTVIAVGLYGQWKMGWILSMSITFGTIAYHLWMRLLVGLVPEIFSMELHTPNEIAQAMCQSEIVHEVNVVLSFLPLFASVWFGAFPVFLITSLLAAGYDLLFVMMQRYNRPRMIRLAESMKKRK